MGDMIVVIDCLYSDGAGLEFLVDTNYPDWGYSKSYSLIPENIEEEDATTASFEILTNLSIIYRPTLGHINAESEVK
jgi:hypothetical protein